MACPNANTPATQLTQAQAEEAVLCLVNEFRVANGVPALTRNLRLQAAAQWHAQEAARLRWWAGGGPNVHTNPETKLDPAARMRALGYCPGQTAPPVNENCRDAFVFGSNPPLGVLTPQKAFEFWRDSASHHATMINPAYRETGAAVVLGVAQKGGDADRADTRGAIFVQTFGGCELVEPPDAGRGWTWGDNAYGQLGDGTHNIRRTPTRPQALAGVIGIAGGDTHSLALKHDGSVWAWGRNNYGQLGDGTTTYRDTRVMVAAAGVISIASALDHNLALKHDGSVWAWGYNGHGQLGDGTTTSRSTPVLALNLKKMMSVAAGGGHSLALGTLLSLGTGTPQTRRTGIVWAWGDNWAGQLGDGTTTSRSKPGQVTPALTGVIAIAAGANHSLALKLDGTVWAWGVNAHGQLGNGTTNPSPGPSRPGRVGLGGSVIAIAAGMDHSLALRQDGTVWAWGVNIAGELGDGTTIERNTPVQVHNLTGVVAISAASNGQSLALKRDGTVWAWGANHSGQLGDGTQTTRHTPVRVNGIDKIVAIAAGSGHSLAL